ncbi:MAG: hypothetical protein OEY75_06760 [Hylemonella sp.]|nr:hypothetical protein [Hylemonella sp.]
MKHPLLLLLGLLIGGAVQAADPPASASRVPQPVVEPARSGQCVEPPELMRRNHMDYLKHQRDDTMREGVRGAKYSLKACISCHASQTTNSVAAAKTNFCISCHSFAAVKVDCFECHATQPTQNASSFYPLVHPSGVTAELSRQVRQQTVPAPAPTPN